VKTQRKGAETPRPGEERGIWGFGGDRGIKPKLPIMVLSWFPDFLGGEFWSLVLFSCLPAFLRFFWFLGSFEDVCIP
jgi:hypothetical protein